MRNFLKAATLAATVSAASALVPQAAFAQAAGGVLTVDIARVMSDSAAGKSGNAQIQAKYQGQIQSASAAFNSAATTYNAQVEAARKVAKPDGTGVPPATLQSLDTARGSVQQADQTLGRLQDEVNAVGNYVQSQIIDHVVPIAEQIRAQRHAALVLPRGGALAADPASDITASVIQSLDASFRAVSIVLPQQSGGAAAGAAAAPVRGKGSSQGR
ncbi:MAG: OmpH family outer membrane protein [Sphingomonadaceae bacterium]|nr:OmpH family outer membrane protein [Sphingomonadaceae bacterium]